MKRWNILYSILAFGFTLGISQGQLALWEDNRAEPIKRFPLQVSSLPPADQTLLAKGLRIETQEELTARLEDYLS